MEMVKGVVVFADLPAFRLVGKSESWRDRPKGRERAGVMRCERQGGRAGADRRWDVLAALRVVVSSTAGARWDEVCTVEGFLLPRGKAVCAAMELLQGVGRLAALRVQASASVGRAQEGQVAGAGGYRVADIGWDV